MNFLSFMILGNRIRSIGPMMRDPNVSLWKKALIVGGLIYLVLPFDLIPPFVPVFGFLDDAILWLFILSYLKDELDKYWRSGYGGDSERKADFIGKNIIEGDFTVKDTDSDADPSENSEGSSDEASS